MSSPSKPVNIGSPHFLPAPIPGTPGGRRDSRFGTPVTGTPDLRSLRAQYVGTPPLPNIPPRTGTSTPRPSAPTEPLVFSGEGLPRVPSVSGISARRPAVVGLGLEGVSTPDPTGDIDSLQEDDKVKVLRKHLVSREERQGNNSAAISRQSSTSQFPRPRQEDTEAFPVPYHTAGADITYVCMRMS
jgi:proton-coupled amino acid transporter